MSGTAQPIEWFIARDGRQHGPLSDPEMQKLVELGHLRPTDLVWRAGMADWHPAATIFRQPSAPAATAPAATSPAAKTSPPAGTDLREQAPAAKRVAELQHPDPRTQSPRSQDPRTVQRDIPAARGPHPATQPQPAPRSEPRQTTSRESDDERLLAAIQSSASGVGPSPMQSPIQPGPAEGRAQAAGGRAARARRDGGSQRPRRRWGRMVVMLMGVGLLGAGGAVAYKYFAPVFSLASLTGSGGGSGASTPKATPTPAAGTKAASAPASSSDQPSETLRASPFQAKGEDAAALDGSLQQAAVWQVVKREFPDWYAERLKETAGLRSAKREEEAVTKHLAEALVTLRRKHADQALAAAPDRLRFVASVFLENLQSLAKHSVEACYGYISQGETNPVVLKLTDTPPHGSQMHKQVTAVFDAIADGRKTPRTYLPPRKSDYDALAQELTSRGWSQADLQTFSDPRSLARATPAQVCKMVQDWFAAQIAIKDGEVRQRLLVESLRPVVAG